MKKMKTIFGMAVCCLAMLAFPALANPSFVAARDQKNGNVWISIIGEPYEVCTDSQLLPYLSAQYPGAVYYEWSVYPATAYVEPSTTISCGGIYLYEPGYYTVTCTAYTANGPVSFYEEHHASDCW